MVTDQTNQAIIEHLALHRVSTRASIGKLIPSGAVPDKRMRRLVSERLVRVNKRLAGNRSLYQLTKEGAIAAGVPETRARPLGTQAVLKHLGVLLFCEAKPAERFRIEEADLRPVLGAPPPDGVHCVCRFGAKPVVAQCYVPGQTTPAPTVVRHLSRALKDLKQNPQVAEFIRDGRYGFAVLVDSDSRRKALMDAVRTSKGGGHKPLIKLVRVWVETVGELALYVGMDTGKRSTALATRTTSLLKDEEGDDER